MKKILSVIVTITILAALLSGCSAKNDSKATTNEKQDTGEKKGVIQLVYLNSHPEQWDGPIGKKIIEDFEKENPGIKVKPESYPFNQMFEIVEVKMKAKSADFDIFNVDVPLVASYSIRDYIEPFENYISKAEIEKLWLPAAIKASSYNGKFMAPPKTDSGMILLYNKKILKDAGVDFPANDVNKRLTWEELLEMAKKCTKVNNGNTEIWGMAFDQINRAWNILPLPNSLGGQGISPDGFTTTGYLNSPEWIKAMQFYQDLFNKYAVAPKGVDTNAERELFNNGKIAFTMGDPAIYARHSKTVDVGFAPVPYFKGGKPAVGCGSWNAAINKYSKNKEAAAKFLKYITIGKGNDDFLDPQSKIGARTERLERITKDGNPNSELFKLLYSELKVNAVPRPLTPGFLEWHDITNAAIEDIRNGADVKKSLDDAAAKIDSILKKYKK